MSTTVTVTDTKGRVIGWIHNGGCGHPKCIAEIKAGKPFHAIMRVGVLRKIHFATEGEARGCLIAENAFRVENP